jgi:ABC-2 type transport system ATP-binding protein
MEAERLCDRVAIMDRRISPSPAADSTWGRSSSVAVDGTLDLPPVERLPGVSQARREPDGVSLIVREPHVSIPALLAELERQGAGLRRLATHHATLEDVFVNLTGRTLRDE